MTTFHEKDFTMSGQPGKRYIALGKQDESTEMWPAAHVDLLREQEKSNFFMGIDMSTREPSSQFFTNRPAQVVGAFADPSMSANVPTLLGIAGDRSMRDTGRLPTHDKSLSTHSSTMIEKLRARGVDVPENPANPAAQRTNLIHKKDHLFKEEDLFGTHEMPPAVVKSGRDLMRSMLRTKAQGISDQQFNFYNNVPEQKSFVDVPLPGTRPIKTVWNS